MPEGDAGLRKIADSTSALIFARFGMPALLFIVGTMMTVIGWFGSGTLNRIENQFVTLQSESKTDKQQFWQYLGKINEVVTTHSSDISAIKANVENTSKNLDRLIAVETAKPKPN